MKIPIQYRYSEYTDKEVVDQIITLPYNDEAAAYLIYYRYHPLLNKIYRKIYDNDASWYEDCQGDLFDYLKGKNLDWQRLRSFEWRSHFPAWFGRTASNRFLEIKPYLIGKVKNPISIDDDGEGTRPVQLPDNGIEDYERTQRKVALMEAISMLQDPDQKFVILKRLQGYNSIEIADLLYQSWQKHGIKKYNNKKQEVIPTAAYVDVRTQRAKENLKQLLATVVAMS